MPPGKLNNILKSFLPKFQTLNLDHPVDMKPRFGHGTPPHTGLYNIINQNREVFKEWLVKILAYREELQLLQDKSFSNKAIDPAWINSELSSLDMIMLYTMTVSGHPSTFVEIKSGVSTKVISRAKRDFGLNTKIVSIDPSPRAATETIADTLLQQSLEKTDLAIFSGLSAGDIIFLNLSHRIFPNSDTTIFFLEVLPYLPKGVKVHFHRVYLPYDYPQDMCDKYYSEQYGLAFFLLSNPVRYKTIAPNYFISQDEELMHLLTPVWESVSLSGSERSGSSFWIEIN